MKKVAIIGAGIVGATAAYYLSKKSDLEVTVFDHGQGQATKAAAGIISPWFSKRRNKAWYKMARLGADFYVDLLADLEKSGQEIDFYQRSGVFLLKKDETKLEELYQLAFQRREESPLIGQLAILDPASANELFPGLQGFDRLLYASGGARVDGQLLVTRLLEASQVKLVKEKVTLTPLASGYQIGEEVFDQVILATGAWLGHLLEPLGYEVDVRPQNPCGFGSPNHLYTCHSLQQNINDKGRKKDERKKKYSKINIIRIIGKGGNHHALEKRSFEH